MANARLTSPISPKTRSLLLGHLPECIVGIVFGYFASGKRSGVWAAREGRYEDCMTTAFSFSDVLYGACESGYLAIAELAVDRGGYLWDYHRVAAMVGRHVDLVAYIDALIASGYRGQDR